jgi:DNA-binding CsgD family transcriptional regulator
VGDDDDDDDIPLPEGASVDFLGPDLALLELPEPEMRVPPALTQAEEDVALRVFRGETNESIARARGVSPKTVGNQLESIFRKLGVASRAELVLLLRHVPRPGR